MATKTILAVAIGPNKKSLRISATDGKLNEVRPYIRGLIDGLDKLKHPIGDEYAIEYRECDEKDAASVFEVDAGSQQDVVIFGMSTTVVKAAARFSKSIPIVGIVSDYKAEGLGSAKNYFGVSGRRSQTAGECFERFLATVPTLRRVYVLHKPKYPPSERALKLVKAAAKKRGVTVTTLAVKSHADIKAKLSKLPKRDLNKPAAMGLQVLPVDVSLSAAPMIIELAQKDKNIPTFFPVTDWVKSELPSALGGYGVPQRTCGELMAMYVGQLLWPVSGTPQPKVTEAPSKAFEWVVSRAAAKALDIELPRVI